MQPKCIYLRTTLTARGSAAGGGRRKRPGGRYTWRAAFLEARSSVLLGDAGIVEAMRRGLTVNSSASDQSIAKHTQSETDTANLRSWE